ncbi:MAG: aspartate carbamoyltransferase catalytic subunit [Halobacteriovoraceae bacterium]|nr:aspartate carbamoyltransferase catalytic subunit [Halobacteriovoraceae bacterium]
MANPFPRMLTKIDDLSIVHIEELCRTAFEFKQNAGAPIQFLNPPRFMTCLFLENSTRTKLSFERAAHSIGLTPIQFNPSTSSLNKGEELEETLFTLSQQGIEICIIRSSENEYWKHFSKDLKIKVINGGDGTNEHPSQALLDLMTLMECTENLEGKSLTIFGDSAHSRVAHSLVKLLRMIGLQIKLCGPLELVDMELISDNVIHTDNFDEGLESDFLYFLRVQGERLSVDQAEQSFQMMNNYGLSLERYEKLFHRPPVLHPGPVNLGVEIHKDFLRKKFKHPAGQMIHRQVENSIYMRMAILSAMLHRG